MDHMKLIGKIWSRFQPFTFPILLLAGLSILMIKIGAIQDKEKYNVVFGIALGVALGFTADIFKRTIDDVQNNNAWRKTALSLLRQDAIGIYHTLWLYDRMLKHPETPDHIKQGLPPPLEMKYWQRLKQNTTFLLLGSQKPFDEIFRDLWEFEKINSAEIINEKGEKVKLAPALVQLVLKENDHEKLLLRFMKKREITELENKWVTLAEQSRKTTTVS